MFTHSSLICILNIWHTEELFRYLVINQNFTILFSPLRTPTAKWPKMANFYMAAWFIDFSTDCPRNFQNIVVVVVFCRMMMADIATECERLREKDRKKEIYEENKKSPCKSKPKRKVSWQKQYSYFVNY